jgi:uncharacterized protein YcbX
VKVGTITAIPRWPVKSMIGDALDESAVTAQSLLGDPVYALADAQTGKAPSAKIPIGRAEAADYGVMP